MDKQAAIRGELPGVLMRGAVPIIDHEILAFIQNLPFRSFFTPDDDKSMDIGIQREFLMGVRFVPMREELQVEEDPAVPEGDRD